MEIVRLLLERGIDVNVQNRKGVSALMIAAEKGKLDVVESLIVAGANLNLKDSENFTALDHAVNEGQADVARLLLERGGQSRANFKTEAELRVATRNFALLRAAITNNLAEVKKQLEAGADINTRSRRGDTALILAIEFGYSNDNVAQLLIEKGADPNLANANGETALMWAAERNSGDAAKMLLAHKAAVNLRNKNQQTALHIAAAGLSVRIVEALLTSAPSLNAESAVSNASGIEVDARDAVGRTPLMLAANNEKAVPDEVMQLLLIAGAKVNVQDNEGNTALILATKAGSFSGVEFLLTKHADANLKNRAGATALQLARRIHENPRIFNAELVEQRVVRMLLKAGAKE
jgi:ankyrin repeat protein